MKGFFVISFGAHAAILTLLVLLGTVLSKPHLSYQAVDLMAAPSGVISNPEPVPPTPPVETPKPPDIPKPPPEVKAPPKEAIKLPTKVKPTKKLPKPPPPAPPKPKSSAAFNKAMEALQNQGPEGPTRKTNGIGTNAGAAVVGEAGPGFPYPWYLKIVADKLDKQWHPPEQFQPDTTCVVSFVIHRDGQVDTVTIEKASGDSSFDGLSKRAVDYANPLPGLPSGYPEDTLNVHMTFSGKGGKLGLHRDAIGNVQ